jgi:hypothetical protein
MWAVMGFLLAAAIGLAAVLAVGRRGSAQSDRYPWILYDTAKLHVGVMAGLAGFAFTGIVLVVTLARDRPGVAGSSLDTVIVMFLVDLALVLFCINGLGFGLAALTPLSPRYAGIKQFYKHYGRRIVIADMQLTMVSLAFLWLSVVGVI